MDMTARTGQPEARNTLVLKAPLSGHLMPLERVPDPVFAQKMVGDGVSIDPVSQRLLSPCDGTVVQVHSAGHAVTIATAGGVEVMIHIGLDTVQLKGRGFTPAVKAGEVVATGALLIEFDADYIATHAKSLLTQVVVTTMDRVAALTPRSGSVTAGSDAILELTLTDARVEAQPAAGRSPRTPSWCRIPPDSTPGPPPSWRTWPRSSRPTSACGGATTWPMPRAWSPSWGSRSDTATR
jgi:multiphosphoryl transfer protein